MSELTTEIFVNLLARLEDLERYVSDLKKDTERVINSNQKKLAGLENVFQIDEVTAAKRKYYKEWRAKNRDKVSAAQQRYWKKQIDKYKEAEQ